MYQMRNHRVLSNCSEFVYSRYVEEEEEEEQVLLRDEYFCQVFPKATMEPTLRPLNSTIGLFHIVLHLEPCRPVLPQHANTTYFSRALYLTDAQRGALGIIPGFDVQVDSESYSRDYASTTWVDCFTGHERRKDVRRNAADN